jgi:hypothetical protein
MTIWAFNKVESESNRILIYQSIKNGKSRFGWSQKDNHNLSIKNNWTDWHSKQQFLLDIKENDWIIHINTPIYNQCIASKVIKEYSFDEGLQLSDRIDFRHFFEIDKELIIEFNRKDPNILPIVNLNPRQRYHKVYEEKAFFNSIYNLKNDVINLDPKESKEEFHLRNQSSIYFKEITRLIHETHKSKKLEFFLAKVFRRIPNVKEVKENGSGFGTDYGADLIVTMVNSIGNLEIKTKIIIQIKSYENDHNDLNAVDQIKTGIKKYDAQAGILITTAQATKVLNEKILKVSEEINCPIDLLSGDNVAKFVIKHASDLVFNLSTSL